MQSVQVKERIVAAQKLLAGPTVSKETFDAVYSLLKGINPRLDEFLASCAKPLNQMEKLKKGEIIELTAEAIPETTEEQKKRKKYLLLLIKFWKQLKGEVSRVQGELDHMKKSEGNATETAAKGVGRVIGFAQGPFGLVTIAAVVVVGFLAAKGAISPKVDQKTSNPTISTVKVIEFQGKKIAVSQLRTGVGPECDKAVHYHAKNSTDVTSLDGARVIDPGGCGFGKVENVEVVEVSE